MAGKIGEADRKIKPFDEMADLRVPL